MQDMWQDIDTLNDLVGALTELAESYDQYGNSIGSMKVRIAYQREWPIAGRIATASVCNHCGEQSVWLAQEPVSSSENPYAPRNSWEGGVEGMDFPESEEW